MKMHLILATLQLLAGTGFCLNAIMDAGNNEYSSMALALAIGIWFFILCLRNVEMEHGL